MLPPDRRALECAPRWRGNELFAQPDWELVLGAREADELRDAVWASRDRTLAELIDVGLPLPALGAKLESVQQGLETGCGARRVQGFPMGPLTELDLPDALERGFVGLARHVGTPLSQNHRGECLLHVRDEGHAAGDPRVRGPNTNRRLSFHTDRCDVIAFLCRTPAASGGETHILASAALFEELQRRHPEALDVLRRPFPYLRHTIDPGNERPFIEQPIFTFHAGHFAASFLRVLIDRAHRDPAAPTLDAAQVAALDTLESVAEDPDLYARLRLEAGDVLLLNNWVTFHRRTAFQDAQRAEDRRHLLRLWLSVPNSRPLDPRFADHFGATGAGALRGGIHPARNGGRAPG